MYKQRLCSRSLFGLVAILVMSMCGCTSPIEDIAGQAAQGLGKVTANAEGSQGTVVLFEEDHSSITGQIEIAQILVRLRRDNGVRVIGLEGSFEDQQIRRAWASAMNVEQRVPLAARLLGEGEISNAEFMAAAFDDVQVSGIDSESLYSAELSRQEASARFLGMMLIAEPSLSPSQQLNTKALIDAKKFDEAMELVVAADPWTRQLRQAMKSRTTGYSIGESRQQLDDMLAEAERRGIDLPRQVMDGMAAEREFLDVADRRSEVMVESIRKLLRSNPKGVIAAIIGAGHTAYMTELLEEASIGFVVITPNAWFETPGEQNVTLEPDRYQRKLNGKSVDAASLGGILTGRGKKPPSVIDQPWLADKANVYYATTLVVESLIVKGVKEPFDLAQLPAGVFVDPNQIRRIGDEIMFPVDIGTSTPKQRIWVRAAYSNNTLQASKQAEAIRRRVDALIAEVKAEPRPDVQAGGSGDGEPPIQNQRASSEASDPNSRPHTKQNSGTELTPGVYAMFSTSEAALLSQSVLALSGA